jgi:acetyltransferase-like isoleucine patch superfamily enzyme
VLLDGAIVGEGCVVGAHSLVNGTLDAYGVYVGIPAKRVAERGARA